MQPQSNQEVKEAMDWKRKLVILAIPAALTVSAGGMLVAHAATPRPAPVTSQPAEPAETTTEPAGAAEAADPAEAPGAAQAGHTDPAGTVDHQFDGQE
jgi:hypothetical protein